MIPFEFMIDGPPVSSQTKNRRRLQTWKTRVRQAAQTQWPAGMPPVTHEVSLSITYFYESEAPDVDNIIKPIQDALVGVVYADDVQVENTASRKSKIDGAFRVKGVPPDLAVRLALGREFLRIRVLPAPDHEDLT